MTSTLKEEIKLKKKKCLHGNGALCQVSEIVVHNLFSLRPNRDLMRSSKAKTSMQGQEGGTGRDGTGTGVVKGQSKQIQPFFHNT